MPLSDLETEGVVVWYMAHLASELDVRPPRAVSAQRYRNHQVAGRTHKL
jgi:hypothetical protein